MSFSLWKQLIPMIDETMLTDLKMQQLRKRPYADVKEPLWKLTEDYLKSYNNFTRKAMQLGLMPPQIIKP